MPFRDLVGHRHLTSLLARSVARGPSIETSGAWRSGAISAQSVSRTSPDRRARTRTLSLPHGSTTTASTMSPGMIVRFGSARMTASSTSSSTTTMTRSAAKAASFWHPSRPQTCVSPPADAR